MMTYPKCMDHDPDYRIRFSGGEMITKTYQPSITNQDIQSALNLENTEYSEETKVQLAEAKRKYRKTVFGLSVTMLFVGVLAFFIGWLFQGHWVGNFGMVAGAGMALLGLISFVQKMVVSFMLASQKDPRAVMRSFTEEVVSTIKDNSILFADLARVVPLVAPSTLKNISVEMFSEDLKKINQDVRSAVKSQETAICAECSEKRSGLWSVESWELAESWELSEKSLEENRFLLRCNNCDTVYCSTCYLKMPTKDGFQKQPNCPNCGKSMRDQADQFQPLRVFLPNPDVSVGIISIDAISVEEVDEHLAHLQANVKIVWNVRKIIVPESAYVGKLRGLGDRGNVECHFYNTAVKIAEKWYLLAALPSGAVSN